MSESELEKTHQNQFASVGRFVAAFEWCCWKLRFYSCAILQEKGLSNWQLADVIFNQRVFTAEPLFSCFSSMIAELVDDDHEVLNEISKLRKKFKAICKKRNDLLHGTYLIGQTSESEPTDMLVEKYTPDKNGARIIEVVSSEKEMHVLIVEISEVRSGIENVFNIIWAHLKGRT